jgi:hypothetical protein
MARSKKSCSNLPSPKTRRSSVNPKNGIRTAEEIAVTVMIPVRVPPPIAVKPSAKECP